MSVVNLIRPHRKWIPALKSYIRSAGSGLRHRLVLAKLTISIRNSRPIIGEAPAVVCLTSYGSRIRHVHYTIMTIANAASRPKRIILWISYSDAHLITRKLRSLQKRGLEVRLTEDYGSHKKYYPYCAAAPDTREDELPLVTADDDVLYPTRWLSDMIDAAATETYPVIIAHRAHRMKFDNGAISPYLSWGLGSGTVEPSYANVATGVCGVLYPLEFILQVGKKWNTEFIEAAPSTDDLWLHSRSVLLEIPTKQVSQVAARIVEHHPNYADCLALRNVSGGRNDLAISRVYSSELISMIQLTLGVDEKG
jgi:hypothetical protein